MGPPMSNRLAAFVSGNSVNGVINEQRTYTLRQASLTHEQIVRVSRYVSDQSVNINSASYPRLAPPTGPDCLQSLTGLGPIHFCAANCFFWL